MKYMKSLLLLSVLTTATLPALAQSGETVSSASHPAAIVMVSIIALLAFVILLLGNVMVSSYAIFKKRNQKTGVAASLVTALLLISVTASAQDLPSPAVVTTEWIAGLNNTTVTFLVSIIALELIIIFYMASVFRSFTRVQKVRNPAMEKQKKWSWLEKLNNTKTVDKESEEAFNLGHDYDGIEELDNPTPPWWQWGFVASGIFAVIYMWVYFVSYSAPNQIQELEIANARAEERIKAYMASSANKIDENTVTVLTEPSDLNEGKKIYIANCAACHMVDGGGMVGPNLTDAYWLHGGSINDIFKTIKYGVPEKGMKSWKDDFTPKQIAQISSFVHSLQGTAAANPKEPQGELYQPGSGSNVAEVSTQP